jgi:hypothetical protein
VAFSDNSRGTHLGNHVHAHGVSCLSCEADEESSTSHRALERLEAGEARGRVEGSLEDVGSFLRVDPSFRSSALNDRREPESRASGHRVLRDDGGDSAADIEGLAAARGRGDEGALCRGHRDGENDSIDPEGSGDAHRDGHITDNIFAALAHHARVIVMEVRELGGFERVAG